MSIDPITQSGLEPVEGEAPRQPTSHEGSRRHWPDDGLPARHTSPHAVSPLEPLSLLGAILGRR